MFKNLEQLARAGGGTRGLRALRVFALANIFCFCAQTGFAGAIPVPDGSFTTSSGAGGVGGGLLDTSGSGTIGSGPWSGTYNAVVGLLVPPRLTIATSGGEPSGGEAVIGGLLAAENLLNLSFVDNGGFFSQTLTGTDYLPFTAYTLTANVDANTLLTASVLDTAGAGIELLNGGSALASSTDPSDLLSITLLGGTNYQLQVRFTTGASAPSGDIGIELFDLPNGLAQVNLLDDVAFSNVTLDATGVPEPGVFILTGIGLVGLGVVRRRRPARP